MLLKVVVSKFGVVHLVREDTGQSLGVILYQREGQQATIKAANTLVALWNDAEENPQS